MSHPLVTQLRFARSEFVRCLEGVNSADACRRILPMNCLSWIVGHLASQEHFLWVQLAQEKNLVPNLRQLVGFGQPPSTPPWEEMWDSWNTITKAADKYLDDLTARQMDGYLVWEGKPIAESIGLTLLRNIYHYWFHLGEAHAMRQMLGHTDLPDFVGDTSWVEYSSKE